MYILVCVRVVRTSERDASRVYSYQSIASEFTLSGCHFRWKGGKDFGAGPETKLLLANELKGQCALLSFSGSF